MNQWVATVANEGQPRRGAACSTGRLRSTSTMLMHWREKPIPTWPNTPMDGRKLEPTIDVVILDQADRAIAPAPDNTNAYGAPRLCI